MNTELKQDQPPLSVPERRRLFICGAFDMRNYGDLMFPVVASAALGRPVQPVAPTAVAPPLSDAVAPIAFDTFAQTCNANDAVLIGGGHIVHSLSLELLPQYVEAGVTEWGGAALWFGASLVASFSDAPLVWNAPGAPYPLPRERMDLILAALAAADYVSVRDTGSAGHLPGEVPVVPDTIAGIASIWPLSALEGEMAAFRDAYRVDAGQRLWTLHIRDRSLHQTTAPEVAAAIDGTAERHGLLPVFCALGQAHQDEETARRIAGHLEGPHRILDEPKSLREVTAVLAHSAVHSGSSLHGYMVAAAYGVPSLLVARPPHRKFSGFLAHSGTREDLVRSWAEAFARLPEWLSHGRGDGMPADLLAALDRHWRAVAHALAEGPFHPVKRREFLRTYFVEETAPRSPAWLLQSFAEGTPSLKWLTTTHRSGDPTGGPNDED